MTALSVTSDLISVVAYADNRITPKNIIIRTSWSMDELGARLYLPAAFKMIQRNIPGAIIHFWPYSDDKVVMDKIQLNTTHFSLLTGDLDNQENSGALIEILKKADMIFHFGGTVVPGGSNGHDSGLLFSSKLFEYCVENNIPYVLHSLKIADESKLKDKVKEIINKAAYVYSSYTADKKTLDAAGITNKNYEPVPDADFYFDLNEDISAGRYLRSVNLAGKQFLIIGLRRHNLLGQDLELEKYIPEFNGLIKGWVGQTGNPVLIISGDRNDAEYIKNNLIDSAAQEIRDRILFLEDMDNPSTILSVIDKARICTGNDPYTLMMSVSTKVPVLFTRTTESDRTNEIFLNAGLDERILNLISSQSGELTSNILSMNKNYVDELVEISKVSKILTQSEKKSFKSIDKSLGIKIIDNERRRPSGGYSHQHGRPAGY